MRIFPLACVALVAVSACKSSPAEPEPPAKPTETTTATTNEAAKRGTEAKKGSSSPGDPQDGSFTLAEATKDLKGNGAIVAKIETNKGTLQCKLFDDKAPLTVANFIGLATGKRAWKDPKSGEWVKKPAYDGLSFHRIIKGFMIQGGDPRGDGTGEPGYTFPDEIWEGGKHDRAGLLCMANRGKDTNGAQFFITDAATPHLDGKHTIFGECAPVELVHEIASVQTGRDDKPASPVTMKSVTISRDEKKK